MTAESPAPSPPGSPQSLRLPRLPACQACSQKKIRCDNQRPSCANCARSAAECFVYDSVTDELVSRTYIHHLEEKQRQNFHNHRPEIIHDAPSAATTGTAPMSTSAQAPPSNPAPTSPAANSSTVTNRGGLSNFLSLLFSDRNWRKSHASMLRDLTKVTNHVETRQQPCPLPSEAVGRSLFETYLSSSHMITSILLRRELWELHNRVFAEQHDARQVESHDLFRAFMVYAMASVTPYRKGDHHQHPEGYYLAALSHLDRQFLTRGLRAVEDIILICRYGIYENIGTSIWELLRLCGRLVVELELNVHDGPAHLPLIEKQHRRRAFWTFYGLDRYSSTTLDRPFAIDDADIHAKLPLDIDDHELEALEGAHRNLDEIVISRDPAIPSETSVLLLNAKLRLVSSHIHTAFSKLREECLVPSQLHLTIGRIYVVLNQHLEELKAWRAGVPCFEDQTCVYHNREWHDFLYARERLYLIRRAIDIVPRRNGVLPKHFSTLLLHAALDVIKQYPAMFQSNFAITYTRSYFHIIFTAGLSVIYCVASKADLTHEDLLSSAHSLQTCETSLTTMGTKLHHSHPYVTVFTALHRDVSREIQKALQNSAASSQLPTSTSLPNQNLPQQFSGGQDQQTSRDSRGAFSLQINPEDSRISNNYAHSPADIFGNYQHPTVPNSLGLPSAAYPPLRPVPESVSFGGEGMAPPNPDAFLGSIDDLQDGTFGNDLHGWDIDTMLWEYVHGDPHMAPFLPGSRPEYF